MFSEASHGWPLDAALRPRQVEADECVCREKPRWGRRTVIVGPMRHPVMIRRDAVPYLWTQVHVPLQLESPRRLRSGDSAYVCGPQSRAASHDIIVGDSVLRCQSALSNWRCCPAGRRGLGH